MKKILLAFLAISIFSCAQINDEKVIATYGTKNSKGQIKIKDVKNDFLNYALYDQSILSQNVDWYKERIKESFIAQELQYIDLIEMGYTNSPNYISNYQKIERNIYDGTLIRKGQELVNKKSKNGKLKLARASHILFLVSKYTNIDGKEVEKSEQDYQNELKEAESKAINLISSLKAAKNFEKEFKEAAKSLSADPGSRDNGGDLGYFTEGMMVKEFEDAIFNAKKKGLIENPVKTPYGYHIIYVTDPAKERALSEIKSKIDKDSFKRTENVLSYKLQELDKEKQVKNLYEINEADKKIIVDGNAYDVKQLPEDTKILEVYGKKYSWQEAKEIIGFYVPNFLTNLDFNNFVMQMGNLKNFLYFRDIAKNQGYEKTKDFKKDYNENLKKYSKNILVRTFENELFENAKKKVTEVDAIKYYSANKERFTKTDKNNKKVLSPFKDVKESIMNELAFNEFQTEKKRLESELINKYPIKFNDSAIRTLINMEKVHVEKFKKEQQKKKPGK